MPEEPHGPVDLVVVGGSSVPQVARKVTESRYRDRVKYPVYPSDSSSSAERRVTVDASAFNAMVYEEHHDPPRIEDILFEESLGKILSSGDFQKGFFQIPISRDIGKFLGFQVNGRTYEYTRILSFIESCRQHSQGRSRKKTNNLTTVASIRQTSQLWIRVLIIF